MLPPEAGAAVPARYPASLQSVWDSNPGQKDIACAQNDKFYLSALPSWRRKAHRYGVTVGLLLSPPVRAAIPETVCGVAVSRCDALIPMPSTVRAVVMFAMMVFVPVLTRFSALPRGLRTWRTRLLRRRR